MAVAWRCIETGRLHADSKWMRLKFRLWRPFTRFAWTHRVCKHYAEVDVH